MVREQSNQDFVWERGCMRDASRDMEAKKHKTVKGYKKIRRGVIRENKDMCAEASVLLGCRVSSFVMDADLYTLSCRVAAWP